MKGFGKLFVNELTKIWKQIGYRVVLFVLIGFAVLTPVFSKLIVSDYSRTAKDTYNSNMELAEMYDADGSDAVYREFYTACAESYVFFINNDLNDDWKFYRFGGRHEFTYIKAYALKLIETGRFTEKELYASMFSSYLETEYVDYENYQYYEKEEAVDKDKYKNETYAAVKAELDRMEKEILDSTERDYTVKRLEEQKTAVDAAKSALLISKTMYEAKPSDAGRQYDYECAQLNLEMQEKVLAGWQAVYDNSAPPNGWEYMLVERTLSNAARSAASCVPLSQSQYESEAGDLDVSYSQYVRNTESKRRYYTEAVDVYLYSVQHRVQLPSGGAGSIMSGNAILSILMGSSDDVSTKAQLRSSVQSFISTATILMIVIASGIISSEFSSGTVRLLLVRPRSRVQIIASKLVCVGAIFAALTAVMTVVLTAESFLLFGITDAFVNDLVYIGGNVIEIPAVFGLLGKTAVAALPALAFMAVAMLLAALSKKNGLAITLTMLIYVFGSSVSLIAVLLSGVFPKIFGWLVYSPFVYFDLTSVVSPAMEVMSNGGLYTVAGAQLWLGIIYHLIFIGTLVWLTVLSFRKTQIKS